MNHHYFASTAFGWATAETKDEAIQKAARFSGQSTFEDYARLKETMTGLVVKVLLPMNANYTINNFRPSFTEVDGKQVPVPMEELQEIKILNYKGKWGPAQS